MKIKATRGAADCAYSEFVRDEKYFRDYDSASNDILDMELSILTTKERNPGDDCRASLINSSDLHTPPPYKYIIPRELPKKL
jgi:hypothetical protein